MNWPFIKFVAGRYVWPRHSDGFLKIITLFSFLGITLGVATLIIVMSVMNGFRLELSKKILDFNSHLSIYEFQGTTEEGTSFLKNIQVLPPVNVVLPVIEGQAMLLSNASSSGILLRAMPFDELRNKSFIYHKLIYGDFDGFDSSTQSVVVGARLAQKFSLQVGDFITLVSPKGNVTPFGTVPRFEQFKVTGIFEVGMYEYDQNVGFIPYPKAKEFFRIESQWTHLEIYLKNPYATDDLSEKIQQMTSSPLRFISWGQAHASFFEVIQVERNVMFIILSLIILIAAFNIISGLVILVKDKTMDIAILKTMGAPAKSILSIFCGVGSFIGLLGTTIGTLLGIGIAAHLEPIRQGLQSLLGIELFKAEFYFLSQLPSVILWEDVMMIVSMAIVLAFLAALYPAYRASRLNPVEALRQNG